MHMADALLAPAVATTMYAASAIAAGTSVYQLKKENRIELDYSKEKLPTMAVMAALVFAGQMINFTIPGTGSSGHICGGMLLAALLGPWAGFLCMIAVLLIQGLFFADGGLMALGANIWNMSFYGCILGYFLIYKPIMRSKLFSSSGEKAGTRFKIILASVLGCVLTLQCGAFSVVIETSLSGITELPFGAFVALMQPIHLAIGTVEGLATAAVLCFIYEARPELLRELNAKESDGRCSFKGAIAILGITVLVIGGGLSLLASGNPDGLEWSLFGNEEGGYSANMGLDEENYGVDSSAAQTAQDIQESTSFLPDYAFANDGENALGTTVSGIVGSVMVAIIAAIICVIGSNRKNRKKRHSR
ncbi:MAG: energy-coupling factor ABC transporter permease [Firmicutes bacterium]|nr:energy-coupling factor ABC transporter permease [Bacillota bacterium]